MPPPPSRNHRRNKSKQQQQKRRFSSSSNQQIAGPAAASVLSTYRQLLRSTNPRLNGEPTRTVTRKSSAYKAIRNEYVAHRKSTPLLAWKQHSEATELVTAFMSNASHNQTLYESGWLPVRETKKAVDSIAQRVGLDLPENTLAKDLYNANSYLSPNKDVDTGASLRKAFGDSTPFQDIFGSHGSSTSAPSDGVDTFAIEQLRKEQAKRSVIESQQKQMEMLIKQQQDKKKGNTSGADINTVRKDTEDMIAKMIQTQETDLLRKLKTKTGGGSGKKPPGGNDDDDNNDHGGNTGYKSSSGYQRNTNNTENDNEWDSAKAFAEGRMFYNRMGKTFYDEDVNSRNANGNMNNGGGGSGGGGFGPGGLGGLLGLLGFFDLASLFALFWNSGNEGDDEGDEARRPLADKASVV